MPVARRPVHFNPYAKKWTSPPSTSPTLIDNFHHRLPSYKPTPLISLPSIAQEFKVKSVHLKDETSRFGLPSFKILGASWGTFRAIAEKLDLPLETDIVTLKETAASHQIRLYAATDGNHGRAVARMGAILSIPTEIHVPVSMEAGTIELIQSEGASVVVSVGNYDETVLEAQTASKSEGGILIQDFAFEGYEVIPQWIVDGYLTMFREVDQQLQSTSANLVIAPVGVGSFAQSVVSHFKQPGSSTTILTVEPDTAGCLWNSFRRGALTVERTTPTIMAGLDCGTPSTIAWPLLREGVDASLTISDYEAHEAVLELKSLGVSAGPCGAAPLAALKRLSQLDVETLGLNENSVIVLLCTEGHRDYSIPRSVSSDDPVALTQTLVQINSANPGLGSIPGPGETAIARYITSWLEHRDIETHWIEPTKGRPSVVGVARGTGGGKSLMFNGHIDTVTLMGYEADPLSGKIENGKLYGRGAADMKCGIAAALIALANAKKMALRGDVIFTGVADEENKSIGTEEVLQAGWRADAAIVSEPTNLEIIHRHKGFVWLEVNIHGLASHGSLPDVGIDAISKTGYFLVELDRYARRLQEGAQDAKAGLPSVHASIIKGGEEVSSYPALCTVALERRTIAGETPEMVEEEIQDLLEKLVRVVPNFKYDLKVMFHRSSFELPLENPFMSLVTDFVGKALGQKPTIGAVPFWTDCALLADKGIPSLLWGPRGEGLHSRVEFVEVESVKQVAEALTAIASEFCK
ncbi:Fc.00g011500.m01.CDS01 [Cosmosporella sp. VM-42]